MEVDKKDFNIQFIQKVAMIDFLFYNFTGESNFIKQLMNFDKDNISDRVLKKIGSYCSQSDFQPDIIGRVSGAAKSLCMWVRAMEVYGRVYRVVEPKKQRLNAAMSQLKEKQDALADAKAKLAEVKQECVSDVWCELIILETGCTGWQ